MSVKLAQAGLHIGENDFCGDSDGRIYQKDWICEWRKINA